MLSLPPSPYPSHSLILRRPLRQVMRDPVVAGDGFTYDRAGIQRWLAARGPVSMVTGAPMPHALLIPNQARLSLTLPLPSSLSLSLYLSQSLSLFSLCFLLFLFFSLALS